MKGLATTAGKPSISGLSTLATGLGLSALADGLLFVVLPVWVYQTTGSALQASLTFVVQVAPKFMLVTVAGLLADRLEKKPLLIVSIALRSALVASLFLVLNDQLLWGVYLVLALDAVLTTVGQPASSALLPHLVTDERLPSANGVLSTVYSAAQLVSPAAGAFLLAWLGVGAAVGATVALYAISAAALLRLPGLHTVTTTDRGLLGESLEGFAYIAGHADLRLLHASLVVAWTAQGVLLAAAIPWLDGLAGISTDAFGLLVSAMGAGMVGGGILASTFTRWPMYQVYGYGMLGTGTALGLAALSRSLWLILALFVVTGAFFIFSNAARPTIVQLLTDKAYLGRVFSIQGAMVEGGRLVGLLVTPVLISAISANAALLLAGALSISAALVFPMFSSDRSARHQGRVG